MFRRAIRALLLAAVAGACAHPAATRFANEYDCREELELTDLGAHAYRVRGCGREAVYVCDEASDRSSHRSLCITERASAPSPGAATSSSRARRTQSRLVTGTVNGAEALRFSIDHVHDVELLFAPGVDDGIVAARVTTPSGQPSCEELALRGHRVEVVFGPSEARSHPLAVPVAALDDLRTRRAVSIRTCGRTWALTLPEVQTLRTFLERVPQLRERVRGAAARRPPPVSDAPRTSGPNQPPRVSDAPPTSGGANPASDTEDRMRRWLDGQRDVILACASSDLVVVRVIGGDGENAVSLGPPLTDSPAQACVRSALSQSPVELDPGQELVHAVRR